MNQDGSKIAAVMSDALPLLLSLINAADGSTSNYWSYKESNSVDLLINSDCIFFDASNNLYITT